VRSVELLSESTARSLEAVVFDLDDTVLDHGALGEAAYRALFRLREAGLELFACTGRPAAWAEIVARQWPVRGAVAENGAVAWARTDHGLELLDPVEPSVRAARRTELEQVTRALRTAFPELTLADDNGGRRTDVTFDVGEHRTVAPDTVRAARALAQSLGVRTFVSSVHLHLTLDTHDKASGFAALSRRLGRSPVTALRRALYVGDSGNDAAAFAAFGVTVGVANVRPWLGRLTIPPRFVTRSEMGAGFAEVAAIVARLRLDGRA
jgi:hypothetical protein